MAVRPSGSCRDNEHEFGMRGLRRIGDGCGSDNVDVDIGDVDMGDVDM